MARQSLLPFITMVCLLAYSGTAFAPIPVSTRMSSRLFVKEMTEEERTIAMDKAVKAMTAFSNKYLENTCTTLCADKSVPAVVIKGLAEHKVTLGAPLCPCRFYEDKEKEAKDGYWNCPCVPMRERHECHCMLFLTEDNDFAGKEQVRYICLFFVYSFCDHFCMVDAGGQRVPSWVIIAFLAFNIVRGAEIGFNVSHASLSLCGCLRLFAFFSSISRPKKLWNLVLEWDRNEKQPSSPLSRLFIPCPELTGFKLVG